VESLIKDLEMILPCRVIQERDLKKVTCERDSGKEGAEKIITGSVIIPRNEKALWWRRYRSCGKLLKRRKVEGKGGVSRESHRWEGLF